MQTRSQSKRIQREIERVNVIMNAKDDLAYDEFRKNLKKIIDEYKEIDGRINQIKHFKKMFDFIGNGIPWYGMLRAPEPERVKKLLKTIHDRAEYLIDLINRMPVTMNDFKLLTDTHSITRHVRLYIEWQIEAYNRQFPDLQK